MRTNTKLTLVAISIILIALAGFYAIKINTAIAPIDGEHTASTTTETSSPLVRLTTPRPNAEIITPLIVTGEARGNWYFEASFPVRLLDGNGKEIAVVPAQAQGDWMTTDFVPFRAELTFILPNTKEGTLVLEKDNPSGLLENADEVRIPIRFKTAEKISSGMRGKVILGPTCPVLRDPPDPSCDDKPFATELLLIEITGDKARNVKRFNSTKDGAFSFEVSPGRYRIQSATNNTLTFCSSVDEIVVTSKDYTEAIIHCDSGIR